MTIFKSCLTACGLSYSEASVFLDVRVDTIKNWGAGRIDVPDGVWSELRELYSKQMAAANQMLSEIDNTDGERIFINTTAPDNSWPTDSAYGVAVARAIFLDQNAVPENRK